MGKVRSDILKSIFPKKPYFPDLTAKLNCTAWKNFDKDQDQTM